MSHRKYKLSLPAAQDALESGLIGFQSTGTSDLIGILHQSGYTDVSINFADDEYSGLDTFHQFKLACAACFRISMSCECVTVFEGVRKDHLKYIIQNHKPVRKKTQNIDFANIRTIKFHESFNEAFDTLKDKDTDGVVYWPRSLQNIVFGNNFNQPVVGVSWPPFLESIIFGYDFNQPLVGVDHQDQINWPPLLKSVAFGHSFNRTIEGVSWPENLLSLTFGESFNQPLGGVSWPPMLASVTFGKHFNQPIWGVSWPVKMESLTFGFLFDQPIGGVSWPENFSQSYLAIYSTSPLTSNGPRICGRLCLATDLTSRSRALSGPKTLSQLLSARGSVSHLWVSIGHPICTVSSSAQTSTNR